MSRGGDRDPGVEEAPGHGREAVSAARVPHLLVVRWSQSGPVCSERGASVVRERLGYVAR